MDYIRQLKQKKQFQFVKIQKWQQEIPTAQPSLQTDLPDVIYKDEVSKWNAIAKECQQLAENNNQF
eukprot:4466988-Ditylum_brightwellii.AAC.1